jgi:hypothetical protein
MLGRHCLSLLLISCDPDIERTLRQLRSERNSNLLGERTIETMGDDNPMALRDHYLPTTYTSPTCLRLPDVTAAHLTGLEIHSWSKNQKILPLFVTR